MKTSNVVIAAVIAVAVLAVSFATFVVYEQPGSGSDGDGDLVVPVYKDSFEVGDDITYTGVVTASMFKVTAVSADGSTYTVDMNGEVAEYSYVGLVEAAGVAPYLFAMVFEMAGFEVEVTTTGSMVGADGGLEPASDISVGDTLSVEFDVVRTTTVLTVTGTGADTLYTIDNEWYADEELSYDELIDVVNDISVSEDAVVEGTEVIGTPFGDVECQYLSDEDGHYYVSGDIVLAYDMCGMGFEGLISLSASTMIVAESA
ncbi:MAG: hypothetical protein IJ026_01880 [Candidatus Methanomethylophilaceae archaeon]|nr:hypothetical protein [Candidatus Methanomethylophilaceae archaeon]